MNKSDLIKKLENIEVPQIELQSHRESLKGNLLSSKYFEEQEIGTTRLGRWFTIFRFSVTRQPKWKTATVSILVLALIAVLSITIPSFNGKSNIALAEEIVRNSEAFKIVSVGEGKISAKQVVEKDNGEATVTFTTEKGNKIVAQVDLKSEQVKSIELKVPGVEITGAEKAEAIRIATADPRVKELLDGGYSFQLLWPIPLDHESKLVDLVLLPGDQDGKTYYQEGKIVRVNITKKEVISINNFGMLLSPKSIQP